MDFTYLSITLTMLGLTAALYLWQEPKIKPLEEMRLARLKERADSLANRNADEIYRYLLTADEKDRNILMSVKAFSPYPAIRWALGIAVVLSLAFGLAARLAPPDSFSRFGISIADISSIVHIPIWFYVGYQLWGEFRYMKEVTKRFS
ncbi:MAG: hypothetical protein IPM03_10230 [Sulfuritalea sp.]|nr:hypothetical protein [Sulfuritalea sp.]